MRQGGKGEEVMHLYSYSRDDFEQDPGVRSMLTSITLCFRYVALMTVLPFSNAHISALVSSRPI